MINAHKTTSHSTCHKHCKSRAGKVTAHTPSIKCHEEVMSRLSSHTNEECYGGIGDCPKLTCSHNAKAKLKRVSVKTVASKSQLNIHQSASAPGSKLSGPEPKDLYPKTAKSKSVSTIPSPNFNDSVDFIPVKLTTVNEFKQRPQKKLKQNYESRPRPGFNKRTLKPYRPTWDEILRNNLEVVSREKQSPQKKALQSNKVSNCCNSDGSSDSASEGPRKHSSKETKKRLEQKETKQDELKPLSERSDLPKQGIMTAFQSINASDPVKSLDFLIKQLRDGLSNQPLSDNLQNIIMDMENAMMKISVDNKSSKSHQLHREVSDRDEFFSNGIQSANSIKTQEKVRNKHIDIVELEQNLEKSCRYLQSLCIKQRESCSNHLQEKDQLSLQLAESRRLLAVSKSKEKNYEVSIGELRLKLQESNSKIDLLQQRLNDVESKNVLLNEENKVLRSLKDSLKRVGVRLKQIASEKENLQSKLSLKDLEIEKLKVLLQMKTGLKDDDRQLKEDEQLLSEKELDLKLSEKDLSMISLSTVSSWSGNAGLMCSSQASGSPRHSPSPYNSWQHISSIVQEPTLAAEIHRDIARDLRDLQREYRQLEPPALELHNPSSCSSVRSFGDGKHSDGESQGFSS